uniref:DUF247 domain-containing protein n=1 Tax=Leersia perrieri TaxID=77586 RepID=A0A0D9UWT3_9ORYZ
MANAEDQNAVSFGSSSMVVEIDKMVKSIDLKKEEERWSKPSIYRVPTWMKDTTKFGEKALQLPGTECKTYQPRVVSLGPFHHGEPNLLPMEEHKQRAMCHLVKRSRKPLAEFAAAIEAVADTLMDAYEDLDEDWRGEGREKFVLMMVTDGCFLLELMRSSLITFQTPGRGFVHDYAPNDPIFSCDGILTSVDSFPPDVILMENQLPLLTLERLLAVQLGGLPVLEGLDSLCLHPLDVFHKSWCGGPPGEKRWYNWESTMPSASALFEAGISFKMSETVSVLDLDFKDGVLTMPVVMVGDETESRYLNMMAFERLHLDAPKDVTAYLAFMDNLIDSEADVKLLRDKKMLHHTFGSNQAVADLFNDITKGASLSPLSKVHDVQRAVNGHCRKRLYKLRASFVHTYMSTPWVFSSLVAAIVLLVATLLQTIYSVMAYYKT